MIERLLLKHNIDYSVSGGDFVVKCFNPTHDDHNPSMRIDKVRGLFNCPSCNYGGGLLKLLLILGEPEPSQSLKLQVKVDILKNLLRVKKEVSISLPEDKVLVKTFRGLSSKTIKDHDIFYVTRESSHGELYSRYCVPIYNKGKVKFIEARASKDSMKPKYLRYPETTNVDFFMSENCGSPLLVLVEGIYDYLNLYDLGIKNVSPLFGLGFNYKKSAQLKDYGFIGVINMLDNDDAGNRASDSIEKICGYHKLIYKRFYCNTDPGDITKEQLPDMVKRNNCKIQGAYLL